MHLPEIWPTGLSGISVALVIYYNNRSYNITCCIAIIKPLRHAYIKNSVDILILALKLLALIEVLYNSCNMGTCDLPEIYALNPQAAPSDFGLRPRTLGIRYCSNAMSHTRE